MKRLQLAPSGPWRARLEIACWHHGHAWALALACGLVAAGLALTVVLPMQSQLAELRLPALAPVPAAVAAAPAQPADGWRELHELLRAAPPIGQALDTMHRLAQAEQIALPRADYHQRQVPGASLVRVQVTQPVQASYPQLRRYVESVLRQLPSASLEQIAVRRDQVSQHQLEARLRWSLWRPAPGFEQPDQPRPNIAPLAVLVERELLLPLRRQDRRGRPAPARDLFAVRDWSPALPAAVPAAATEAAPPLPFVFLGKKLEDGRWDVFVSQDDEYRVLRAGQTVDGSWRVDRIAPPEMNLTHLPSGQSQSLAIGDMR